jgi:hypothetical protein
VPTSIPISFIVLKATPAALLSATVMVTATGRAQYQLGGQHDPPLGLMVCRSIARVTDHVKEHAGGAASEFQRGLANCGKRCVEQWRELEVIKADHCQIRRQAQLHGADSLQCVDGRNVV